MSRQVEGPLAVLATYPSDSTPGKSYDVCLGNDGVTYCRDTQTHSPCFPWLRSKTDPKTCKHTKRWIAEGK